MQSTLSYFEQLTIQHNNRDFILNVIALVVALLSVIAFYIDYRSRKSKERAEKSILIAKEFAEDIIVRTSLIGDIFTDNGLTKIITKVKFSRLEDFTVEELNSLYSKEDIYKYYKALENIDNTIDKQFNEKSISIYLGKLLNSLEYMCMYIATEVADGEVIYNSLHQNFLNTIHLLYIFIASSNSDNKDKFYTNIIYVYNNWKEIYIRACKKEEKYMRKLKDNESRMIQRKEKISKKLNPKIKKTK